MFPYAFSQHYLTLVPTVNIFYKKTEYNNIICREGFAMMISMAPHCAEIEKRAEL